jgi:uncharacterized protein YebE (UPF0316 family)
MDLTAFMGTSTFTYVILPALIFLSRICDVTIGTIRIVYVSRGLKVVAPILGFFEVLIWLLAITQIIQNLTSPIHYIAYAAGFAAGNYVGLIVEEKLSVGTVLVRVITRKDPTKLLTCLTENGIRVTKHEAVGTHGPVNIIFTIMKRKEVGKVLKTIKECNPTAFYTIEDVRYASGTAPPDGGYTKKSFLDPLRRLRKSK